MDATACKSIENNDMYRTPRRARLCLAGVARKFVALSALLLGLTYFMPAIDCGDPKVNPSQEFRHFVKAEFRTGLWQSTLIDTIAAWGAHLAVYVFPYVVAFLVALGALSRDFGTVRYERLITWTLFGIIFAASIAVILVSLIGYVL